MKVIETYIVMYESRICKMYRCSHEEHFITQYFIESLYGLTEIEVELFVKLKSSTI